MMIFLILAPYGAFAMLMLVTSAAASLFAAAAICLTVIAADVLRGRSIKMLGAGSAIVFLALGALSHAGRFRLEQFGSETGGRCRHARDLAGLACDPPAVHAAICARSGRCRDGASCPASAGELYHHLGVDGAFLLMMLANAADDLCAGPAAVVRTCDRFAARNSALYFTKWYPERQRAKFAASAAHGAPIEIVMRKPTSRESTMKDVFAKLLTDFLSTIVFLVMYLATDNVVLATSVAIAGAVAQVIYSRVKGQPLGFMTYASLALVIVLGSATLLTNDPRFVLAKPSIAHFAIGAIMLKRGWMLRYMPPIVAETIPEYVTIAGYAWAALMFVLGLGVIAVASTGDLKLWAIYVSVVAIGAKIAAFAVQYVAFRILVTNRLRAVRA